MSLSFSALMKVGGIAVAALMAQPLTSSSNAMERTVTSHQVSSRGLRVRRNLQTPFQVQLFLSLYFVDDEMAQNLESLDLSNDVASHFCFSVNEQVGWSWLPILSV